MLQTLTAAVLKETRIIVRDKEALAILFIMPAIFVLIMSMALQDTFREQAGAKFRLLVLDHDNNTVSKQLITAFTNNASFIVETRRPGANDKQARAQLEQDITRGRYQIGLIIPPKTTPLADLGGKNALGIPGKRPKTDAITIELLADPGLRGDHRRVILASLNRALQEIENGILLKQAAAFAEEQGQKVDNKAERIRLFNEVTDPYDKPDSQLPTPTSVQQNAPGWGLLAMFFLVIPLAGTLVREQQEGSLTRLQTMAAPISLLLAGKIVPYFVINQIQIVLILLEGVFLLPLLGGERLDMGLHPWAIVPLSLTISLAAIGYGLMVAAFCRTSEQATVFGAASILILGALGGVMVPKMVMPPAMQELTLISPMSWALDGFLAVFIRGAGIPDILPQAGLLAAFGVFCLVIGIIRFQYTLRHH